MALLRRDRVAWSGAGAVFDVALAAGALGGSLALLARTGFVPPTRGAGGSQVLIGVVLAVTATVPLIVRRRFPLEVFVVTAAASAALAALGYRVDPILGPTVALYFLASRQPDNPWTWRTTAAVAGLFMAYLSATAIAQNGFPRIVAEHTLLGWGIAWFAGERTRLRREQIAALEERSLRLERDAERERLLAVEEERGRIARDLHDSAGHAISLIAVRAGAARLRHHQDPGGSLVALEAVEELARRTVDDIDCMVGALRANGASGPAVESPAGLSSLRTLVAQYVATGMDVSVDISGAAEPVAVGTDQAVYRILQEALTNVARHGAGSAHIALVFGDAAIELTVTNPVLVGAKPRLGGGHGLVGMRERARLLGGSLDAGCAGGTFRVRARIPRRGQGV